MQNYLEQLRENLSRNLHEEQKIIYQKGRVENAFFFYKFWLDDANNIGKVDYWARRLLLIETVLFGTKGVDNFDEIKRRAGDKEAFDQERMLLVATKLTNIRASIISQRGRGTRSAIYGSRGGGSNKVRIDFMDFIWEALKTDCDYESLAETFGCSVSTLYRRIPPKQLQRYVDELEEMRTDGIYDFETGHSYHPTDSEIRYMNRWPKELP